MARTKNKESVQPAKEKWSNVGMKKKKVKEKYVPAKRTIQETAAIQIWGSHGLSTAEPYKVSKRFLIKKLRGAIVCIVGPGNFKKARLIDRHLYVNNKTLKVRIMQMKHDSKLWEVRRFKDKRLLNGAIKVIVCNRSKCEFEIAPRYLIPTFQKD